MLDRQKELYGRYPLKVALDGGFASKDNLIKAKEKQIKAVCFGMTRCTWKSLRSFKSYHYCQGVAL